MKSQGNEEAVVLKYFGSYVGTLLDIGANDGITLSNSYELLQRGWSGCLVEPSNSAFPRLSLLYESRSDIHLFNLAIGTANGTATLFESGEHLGRGDTALLSTLDANELKRFQRLKHRLFAFVKRSPSRFHPIAVAVRTFEAFLAESPIKTFDFITIDAEGFDLSILSQIDLTAIGCKLLIVEFNNDPSSIASFAERAKGYRLVAKTRQNLIFAL